MAQRIVHYLVGELICNSLEGLNRERFLTGSILPDAVEVSQKEISHFKRKTDTHVCFDFERFGYMFSEAILRDDLYLGYYMHLVEDALYRAFVFGRGFDMPRTREEVAFLHNDYRVLNGYVVKKYGIQNCLSSNIALEHEPISKIATFRLKEFMDEMNLELVEQQAGRTRFLTESMLDEFVETCMPLVVKEVAHMKKGASVLKVGDYTWSRKR